MKRVSTCSEVIEYLKMQDQSKVGFVPTMGALHAGHVSLVNIARNQCATVVVSIFVNPTQFNDKNDLKNYPRNVDADLKLLEGAGVDLVFTPSVEEIYPQMDTRQFDFGMIDKVMEGATRPGHFNGVAQVVSRLFGIVKPAKAYFGEKDFQQIAVIREMVRQLKISVEIIACPIVRDGDGLALSSRNMLLDEAYRQAAPQIYAALKYGVSLVGKMSVGEVEKKVQQKIEENTLLNVIYFKIVDSLTLLDAVSWDQGAEKQGCIAVQAGSVRLIDNIRFI